MSADSSDKRHASNRPVLTAGEASLLAVTVSHFQEVARQNRFAENSSIPHDSDNCLVCRPELISMEPFAIYLDVVIQSIKVRRPRLDAALLDEINGDLAMAGLTPDVNLEALRTGEQDEVSHWTAWAREAVSTGLGLLSIHGPHSLEFDLEEAEAQGFGDLIESKLLELMEYQRSNA